MIKKNQNGFTLVELMITTVIVSILIIVAIQGFALYIEESRISEVIPVVTAIRDAQLTYHAEHGHWADGIEELDLRLEGEPKTLNLGDGATRNYICTKNFAYATWEQKTVRSPYIKFYRTGMHSATTGTFYSGTVRLDYQKKLAWQGHSWFHGTDSWSNRTKKVAFVKLIKKLTGRDISEILN